MDTYNEEELKMLYEIYTCKKQLKIKRYNRDGTTANKDSSRTKVYNAEWKFERILKDDGQWKTYSSLEECQKYIDRVTRTKKWNKLSRTLFNDVQATRMKNMSNGRMSGQAWYGAMKLSPGTGFNQYVILHELAHCAGHMHHDISFRKCLVELVSCFIGRDYGKLLYKMFKEAGLKMSVSDKIMPYDKWVKSFLKMERLRQLKEAK